MAEATANTEERATATIKEAARVLGIGIRQTYEAVHRKEIPSIKIGSTYRVPRAWLKRVTEGAA